jgi:hypothetical protein
VGPRVCAIGGFRGHSNCVDLNPHVRDSTSINLFRIYAARRRFAPHGSCENRWRSVRAQASALAPQSDPTSLCEAHSLSSQEMIFGELSLSFAHSHSLYFSLSRAHSLAGLPIRIFHYAVQGDILFVCAGVYLWPLDLYLPKPAAHRQTFTLPPERFSFAYACLGHAPLIVHLCFENYYELRAGDGCSMTVCRIMLIYHDDQSSLQRSI